MHYEIVKIPQKNRGYITMVISGGWLFGGGRGEGGGDGGGAGGGGGGVAGRGEVADGAGRVAEAGDGGGELDGGPQLEAQLLHEVGLAEEEESLPVDAHLAQLKRGAQG